MTSIQVESRYGPKISFISLISEGTRRFYNQFKRRIQRTDTGIDEEHGNKCANRGKTSFSHSSERSQLHLWTEQNLRVYKHKLVCMAINYL